MRLSKRKLFWGKNGRAMKSKILAQLKDWSPIIIALCALSLSIDQGIRNREHDRLTVRPYVHINFEDTVESGAIWKLTNSGLGPAIIKSFQILVDGNPCTNWACVLTKLQMANDTPPAVRVRAIYPGMIVEAKESMMLIQIMRGDFAADLFKNYKFRRVEIRTCYCSLYNECWQVGNNTRFPISVKSCDSDTHTFGLDAQDLGP